MFPYVSPPPNTLYKPSSHSGAEEAPKKLIINALAEHIQASARPVMRGGRASDIRGRAGFNELPWASHFSVGVTLIILLPLVTLPPPPSIPSPSLSFSFPNSSFSPSFLLLGLGIPSYPSLPPPPLSPLLHSRLWLSFPLFTLLFSQFSGFAPFFHVSPPGHRFRGGHCL